MEKLQPKQTLALTATPPYDAGYHEWKRYEQLCGPIDDLISIPELVKNGDLCPHQDFVYFSPLRATEDQKVNEFEAKLQEFTDYFLNHSDLSDRLFELDLFDKTHKYFDLVFDVPDFFISIASYLRTTGKIVPPAFLKLFDIKAKELPEFDETWAETFLNGLFYAHRSFFAPIESSIKDLESHAHKAGLIYRKKVYISSNPLVQKEIASSVGKLDAIVDIVQSEHRTLKNNLRLVILADYIREEMTQEMLTSLGVVPIFLKLSEKYRTLPLAVLTGTLIVIPKDKKQAVLERLALEKLRQEDLKFTPFKLNPNFDKITFSVSAKSKIVKIITDLFNQGVFQVIVGTQALLGEGWDAPSINSLILSSTIASYVLSNQMRGRAIRKDKDNPEKISNIWHLVSFRELNLWRIKDYIRPTDISACNDKFDLKQIEKRFQGYEAPTNEPPYRIQNGLERLHLGPITEKTLSAINQRTLALSADRQNIRTAWKQGLIYSRSGGRMHVGINTPPRYRRTFVYRGNFLFLFCFYLGISIELFSILNRILPMYSVLISLAFGLYFLVPLCYKFIRNGSVSGSLRSIISIILQSLEKTGDIQTPLKNTDILIQKQDRGQVFCSIEGLMPAELNLCLKSLQEFLDPIENPRYVLARRGFSLFGWTQKDYHAVPTAIAAHKKYASFFKKKWEQMVGRCNLIYTRSEQGRRLMLKMRKYAFSHEARQRTFSSNKWD